MVWDQLQKDFPGKATLFVVSDHGFSANKTKVVPNDALEKAGLVERTGGKVTGGPVKLVIQGGSALVYISDDANRESIMKRRRSCGRRRRRAKIVTPDEFAEYGIGDASAIHTRPICCSRPSSDYFFGDTAAGDTREERGAATATTRICQSCSDVCRLRRRDQAGNQARRHREQECCANDCEAAGRRDADCRWSSVLTEALAK